MTKHDFHSFQVCHFIDHFEQSPYCCKKGQRQKADLSVFGRQKCITSRDVTRIDEAEGQALEKLKMRAKRAPPNSKSN